MSDVTISWERSNIDENILQKLMARHARAGLGGVCTDGRFGCRRRGGRGPEDGDRDQHHLQQGHLNPYQRCRHLTPMTRQKEYRWKYFAQTYGKTRKGRTWWSTRSWRSEEHTS